jgi:hypothetical protein
MQSVPPSPRQGREALFVPGESGSAGPVSDRWEIEAELIAYRLVMRNLTTPLGMLVGLNLLFGAMLALLGHPAVAAGCAVTACAYDLISQRRLRRAAARVDERRWLIRS